MRLEPRFQIPDDPKEAIKAISERLRALEDLVQKTTVAQTKLVAVEPAKPRDGMFAYADGTNWDPGAGRGLYQYVNGTWQPVSAPRPPFPEIPAQIPQTPWAQDVDAAGFALSALGDLSFSAGKGIATVFGASGQHRCRAYASGSQTIASGTTFSAIALDSEDYDIGGLHNNVTNNTRVTVSVAGKYLIVGQVCYAINAVGGRAAELYLNGTTRIALTVIAPSAVASDAAALQVTTEYSLAAGDYVELRGYQTSGSSLGTFGGSGLTWLSVSKVA